MPRRFPLFAKILGWFALNLALLGAVGWLLLTQQLRMGFDSLLAGRAGDRLRSFAELAARELNENPREKWDAVLAKFESAYPVGLCLFGRDNRQIAGEKLTLPPEVATRLAQLPLPPAPRPPPPRGGGPEQGPPGFPPPPRGEEGGPEVAGPPPPDERFGPPEDHRPQPRATDSAWPFQAPPPRPRPAILKPDIKGLIRAGSPPRYWLLIHTPLERTSGDGPYALVVVSKNLSGGGLIFDFMPLLWAGLGVIVLSVLFWIPLVRSITRSIAAMRDATASIAEGRFEARVDERRRDELGALGASINAMSLRLSGFLQGQRRFLSDVAHELCAPLSRLQLALGILESGGGKADPERIADLREEVDHMAGLVNELLLFSRAAISGSQTKLRPCAVRDLLDLTVRRESPSGDQLEISADAGLSVMADPDLLQRAVGNLVRNALRYAGEAGPILVSAARDGGQVRIDVADHGPGVPPDLLAKVFDPFFRVDASRTRDTGGVGLGLAIARTSVDACGGKIAARNLQPMGFCVSIWLQPA